MKAHHLSLLVCITLGSSLIPALPALAATSKATNRCGSTTAAKVVVETNAYRASLGLSQLTVAPKLQRFAKSHAIDMAQSAALTHSSSNGLSFAERAHASNYHFFTMRENIAVEGTPFPSDLGSNLLQLWKESPPHDTNMRARDVSQIGVAVAAGLNGCYASMELASPSA
jgi:uncharacterized protein YkwD